MDDRCPFGFAGYPGGQHALFVALLYSHDADSQKLQESVSINLLPSTRLNAEHSSMHFRRFNLARIIIFIEPGNILLTYNIHFNKLSYY